MNVVKVADFKKNNIKFKFISDKKTKITYTLEKTGQLYLSCSGVILGNSVFKSVPKNILNGSKNETDDGIYFFDLNLNKPENINIIEHIDYLAIVQLMMSTNYSLTEIESLFVPSIKYSALNRSQKSLKLKCNSHEMSVYDRDNNIIPISCLENGNKCSVMLTVKYILLDGENNNNSNNSNNRYYLDWNMVQIKVNASFPNITDTDIDYFPEECKVPESEYISTDDEEIY